MAEGHSELRARIVKAAALLLSQGGREAVSTRGVSAAAGVQAPAIYRHFGDMQDLLRAAAREVLAAYVRDKAQGPRAADPVLELRRGWDLHVAFGLANPAAYELLYATADASNAPEARAGEAHLTALVTRVAEAGRLRVPVPLAVKMIHAGGCGVVLSLIAKGETAGEPRLVHAMRDAVLAAIIDDDGAPRARGTGRVATRAVALKAVVEETSVLSRGERQLMAEWLDRMSDDEGDAQRPGSRGAKRDGRRTR